MKCETYCSHGGICELPEGHDGLHDTGYCKFTDAEAVSREQADATLSTKPGGQAVVDLQKFGEAIFDV